MSRESAEIRLVIDLHAFEHKFSANNFSGSVDVKTSKHYQVKFQVVELKSCEKSQKIVVKAKKKFKLSELFLKSEFIDPSRIFPFSKTL